MNDPTTDRSDELLLNRIRRIRSSLRRSVVEARLSTVIAVMIPILFAAAMLDFLFRLPSPVRWTMLLAGLIWLGVEIHRRVWPAIRFRPSLIDVALRIESMTPSVAGRLASAIDFAHLNRSERGPLADRSLSDLQKRANTVRFEAVIDGKSAHQRFGMAVLALIFIGGIAAWSPAEASIATRRILAPWSDARWPARTDVASATKAELVHPRGEPLALAADLIKGDPGSERVSVRLRTVRDGSPDPWRSLVMTRQQGTRFERVVDTNADSIEYEFASVDSETERFEVRFVPAPAVDTARVSIEPPAYAARLGRSESELGPGTDRRSRLARPVLEGSQARIDLELIRPVPIERDDAGMISSSFVDRVLASPSIDRPILEVDPENPTRWSIFWSLDTGGEFEIRLQDEHGLVNLDPIRYRIDTIPDRRPSTTIVDPASDRTVTRSAMVSLQADARDDVGLSDFRIEASVTRSGSISMVEELASLDLLVEAEADPVADASLEHEFDLAGLALEVGDDISVFSLVTDEWVGPDGPREPVRSEVRRLKVVSEADLIEQLQGGLGSIRRTAIRLEGDQAELADRVRQDGANRESTRNQDRLGDRIEGARSALEAVDSRRRENRLDDELLADVLDQAEDLIEAAARSEDQALAALDRATAARDRAADADSSEAERSAAEAEAEEAEREAVEAQQDVQDELTDLAATLDRGEDAWVVSRQIERLAEDLANLQEQTGDLAERTMGRDRDELTSEERRELDDIVREQADLADRSEELLDDLEDRAEAMETAAPSEADGLRQAAEEARQEGLEEEMREAEEQARENRLQQAGEAQQQAAEALERMQETIEESRKAKVDELRRRMESLVESLQALIKAAENEVIALNRVDAAGGDFEARAAAMILVQRNTMTVAGEAAAADDRIGRVVGRAADNQAAAIGELRSDPPDVPSALESEERAISALQEALALAEEAAEQLAQQQADAERDRLLTAYRGVLEMQTGVRVETGNLAEVVGERLDRRQTVKARRLARSEDEVGTAVEAIAEEFNAVTDSLVFSMTHRNLDAWIAEVADRLRDGRVDDRAIERQTMIIASLAGLIESLDDEGPPEDDPFGQQAGGGQGGQPGDGGGEGGPQPLIPPIAELKMLRSMQIQILDATRRIDGRPADDPGRSESLADLGRMQSDLHAVATTLVNTLEPASEGADDSRIRPAESDEDPAMKPGSDSETSRMEPTTGEDT